uniref:Calmodulin n=1 Tax=Amphora coffeiformis TaxID=265554 RepID=A0A7S3L498_9STRA|mmetsp:Transcript_21303/g.40476  ORF Transcript_21303/g.40476 Transcript_21303/m.40476 type:complete len:331 (+) Transcript_21303:136-1128(+)|eukprot:scaffold2224_cov154-Amphora_coffeaeformis.AAC.2
MKALLALFLGTLVVCGKVAGEKDASTKRSTMSSSSMMQMKKWRYSEAAKKMMSGKLMKSSSKSSMSSGGKGSTKSEEKVMMMRRMMMRGKGTGYSPAYKSTLKPTRSPSVPTVPTLVPTILLDAESFQRCLIVMAVADINRDDSLNPEEYVRFILRLSMAQFVGETFEDLDPLLQDNYTFLAGEGTDLNVTGSKPGQTTDDDQYLRRICTYTLTLLGNGVNPPTRVPSPATDEFLAECFLSMALSDTDRNNQLDEAEYVTFVNRFTSDNYDEESFDDLGPILKENFMMLASDGGFIDVTGARPGEETTEELVSVCLMTQEAVDTFFEAFP